MPMPATAQTSFYDPEFLYPECVEPGTVPWLFARHAALLVPLWLVRQWDRPGCRGRPAWRSSVLLALLVLRFRGEGMSRRAAVKRGRTDAEWRAAMRLSWQDRTPGKRVLGRFERFLAGRDSETGQCRYFRLFADIGRVCIDAGVLGEDPVWGTDSTPMLCYGAVLDSVRQLGDGARALATEWSRVTGRPLRALAADWGHPLLVAKSTKGHFRIDWSDAAARADVVESLVRTALDLVDRVRGAVESVRANKRKGLLRRCRNLARVVAEDIACGPDGRLKVIHRETASRLISVTEPQAQHGRKSRKRKFNGFKLHILGDVVSGFIAALCVTPGATHDGGPGYRLITRAKGLVGAIEQVLGDTAYGAARLRYLVRGVTGVEVLAPPPSMSRAKSVTSKQQFSVDFDAQTMTCPSGEEVPRRRWSWSHPHGVQVPVFTWTASTCADCPLRPGCCGKRKGGKVLMLHPYEKQMRKDREAWSDPVVREAYRVRSQAERLVNRMTRHGARKARTWGLKAAQLQAHTIGLGTNLDLLARRLAAADSG